MRLRLTENLPFVEVFYKAVFGTEDGSFHHLEGVSVRCLVRG